MCSKIESIVKWHKGRTVRSSQYVEEVDISLARSILVVFRELGTWKSRFMRKRFERHDFQRHNFFKFQLAENWGTSSPINKLPRPLTYPNVLQGGAHRLDKFGIAARDPLRLLDRSPERGLLCWILVLVSPSSGANA